MRGVKSSPDKDITYKYTQHQQRKKKISFLQFTYYLLLWICFCP